eukprot:m.54905 g.54905  ORF g.54905 m.54905 type:complete len:794 (+) comp9225_c0_seq2:2080-4461(+)
MPRKHSRGRPHEGRSGSVGWCSKVCWRAALVTGVVITLIPVLGMFMYSEYLHLEKPRSGGLRRSSDFDLFSKQRVHERRTDDGPTDDDLIFSIGGDKHLHSTSGDPRSQPSPDLKDIYEMPTPTARTFYGPRKLVLVCLYTGGVSPVAIKEKTGQDGHDTNEARVNARVDAQFQSWASDIDVYHVTHANVSNPRVIRLPKEAESGGYKGIWLKSLLLFDHLANSDFGQQYDYVFKGDDDTLVNLPELRSLLKQLDPALPFQLGNNGYGVGCRGPAPTSLFYRQNRGTDPCHGGAGYVLSRGLLDIMAPHFKGCADEWPMSSYEDAKVSYCLMHHAAVNCMGMKHDFGWDRYHNPKRAMVPMKLKALEMTPVVYAMGISFHPVPAEYQSKIYSRITELSVLHKDEIALKRRDVMDRSHRYMVSQWNCTVPSGRPETSMNALCQQYISRKPPLLFKRSSEGVVIAETDVERVDETGAFELSISAKSKFVVFVTLGSLWGTERAKGIPSSLRDLRLCIATLRAAGCTAAVVILSSSTAQFQMARTVARDSKGNVYPVQMRSREGTLRAVAAAAIARILQRNSKRFKSVLVCPAATIFQLNPFVSIPHRSGLAVFVTSKFPANLTTHNPSGRFVMSHLGTCSTRDDRASTNDYVGANSFRGPGLIDSGLLFGVPDAIEVVISKVLALDATIDKKFRKSCFAIHVLSRAIWDGSIAERIPVLIPHPADSPIVNLAGNSSTLWYLDNGVVRNAGGAVAALVTTVGRCICCKLPKQPQSEPRSYECLDVVLKVPNAVPGL